MGRESILNSIKKNKPASLALPVIDVSIFSDEIDVLETFKKNVTLVGGFVKQLNADESLDTILKELYPNAKNSVALIPNTSFGTVEISKDTNPHSLENVDLAIIKGQFGVAENGAVWISDAHFPVRVLPFITNDLVLVISKNDVYEHMHAAFQQIAERDRTFGVFIAGPSKTADIEQCLVIGAQGAMSLSVFLIDG